MNPTMKKILKSSRFIIIAGLISKLLSLTKETLIASKLGSGAETDTYFTAIIAATLLADIIGEGISLGVVPILFKIEAKNGKKHKLSYINNLLHIVILSALGLIFLGWFFSPVVLKILVRGIEGKDLQSMLKLVRVGLPMGLFVMVRSIFIAFLHSEHSFRAGAKSWIYYYSVYIIFLTFFSNHGIYGLMITGIVASIVQLCSVIPTSINEGYKYESILNFNDVYLKEFLIMLIPIVISTSINMINVVVDKSFASTLVSGSKSWLNYSDTIIQLILGIFVTGIITVLFPMFCQKFNGGDTTSLKNLMSIGTRLILSVIVPTMIILITLANPIVKLLFERGKFGTTDTLMTSQVLVYYALGLISMSMILILTNFHYATHDPITPMKFAFIGVIANFILNLILVKLMAVNGLALATSISSTLIVVLLIKDINKDSQIVNMKHVKKGFVKLLPVIVAMVVAILLVYNILEFISWDNVIIDIIQLIISISIGVTTYIKLGIKTESTLWEITESSKAQV